MGRLIDLTGKKFSRLYVDGLNPKRKFGKAMFDCTCECGNTVTVYGQDLSRGKTTSCGCYALECKKQNPLKHGYSSNGIIRPTYHSWAGMTARCNNPKHKAFKNYGGKGIKVDPRWSSFENFIADMGDKPKGYSLSRIDHDSDYTPINCEWAPIGSH